MSSAYTPRQFDQSPLFQIVYSHFDDFRESYHRFYSDKFGYYRDIVTHTVNRFLVCGDFREGIARFECPKCKISTAVSFSCKTRLFCPSCHEVKILLWIEEVRTRLLLPVPHRFWTFSIPKRLRPYFMRNRKLLSLLVAAANNTLAKALSGGKLTPGLKPGIVSLIQTHSDSLEWNSHLHMVVTDGAVDYTDLANIRFKLCKFWNFGAITEMFRFELIEAMFKAGVLTPEIANNLASWQNSGFHVHASRPFMPNEGDILKTRLAYAFRPAVTLNRINFDGKAVTVTTRKQTLHLTPIEFLARLTLHIPDRYQNIRRYAGFYASIVQCAVRRAAVGTKSFDMIRTLQPAIRETKGIKPNWASLIAKIFGTLPIVCPKCGTIMNFKEFILDEKPIAKFFPDAARAPPKLVFDRYMPPENGILYGNSDDHGVGEQDFCQLLKDNDAFFNQEIAW